MEDIDDIPPNAMLTFLGYSVNYPVDEASFDIQDPESVLRTYQDKNTDSGNQVEVSFYLPMFPLQWPIC